MHKISKLSWSVASIWALIALILLAACNSSGLPSDNRATPTAVLPTAVSTLTLAETPVRRATDVPTLVPTVSRARTATTKPTATHAQASPTTQPTEVSEPLATIVPSASPTAERLLPSATSTVISRRAPSNTPTSAIQFATATDVPAGQSTPSPGATLMPLSERQQIFDQVWDTVNNNYLYPDFHGAEWNALKTKYEPIAENATTSDEFYQAISDMVDELKDDHSRYLSPVDAKDEDDLESGHADYVGIGILSSPEDKSVRIIYVFPNSPAEKAGLKRRDRIVAIDGKPFVDPEAEISHVRGAEGTTVNVTVVSPEQSERVVSIVRGQVTGAVVPSSMRLNTNPSIGYLIIPNLWTDDMDTRVENELNNLLSDKTKLSGLIIDMRGNGGGFRTILESILGDFVSGKVGSFFDQNTSYPLTINSNPISGKLKNVPLVLLVDKGTESYAEVLSASIQEKGRAKVVGVPSAGNTETIFAYDLDDGSRLWCAQEGFKLNDGTNLEGRGVIPDVTIDQDWTAFTDDDDPQILKALELLQPKK